MSKIDVTYQELCSLILSEGKEYENKNRGVKRLQIPSYTLRHSFADGFPALSNKKLYWEGVVGELIWFLRGDNDVKWLNENGIKIWNKDAYNWYVKHHSHNGPDNTGLVENPDGSFRMLTFPEFSKIGQGSVGQNYSVQWRNFNGKTDQIDDLITNMRKDIMSSRLKVNAWNPSEIFETALPPCHSEFQIIGVPLTLDQRLKIHNDRAFYEGFPRVYKEHWQEESPNLTKGRSIEQYLTDCGYPEFGFELHWNQRSVDVFLGLPFNIASYGLLAKILEYITGYKALGIEGTLKCVHFYDNQYEAVKELMSRDPDRFPAPKLEIKETDFSMFSEDQKGIDVLFNAWEIKDFQLKNYQSYDNIKVEMLAPKKL